MKQSQSPQAMRFNKITDEELNITTRTEGRANLERCNELVVLMSLLDQPQCMECIAASEGGEGLM